jgi:hypothetical protein
MCFAFVVMIKTRRNRNFANQGTYFLEDWACSGLPVAAAETTLTESTKVSTIVQTPAFVAANMAPGWKLDSYCADDSINPWESLVD